RAASPEYHAQKWTKIAIGPKQISIVGPRADVRFRSRYWRQSGHGLLHCTCLLMTRSGRGLVRSNCSSSFNSDTAMFTTILLMEALKNEKFGCGVECYSKMNIATCRAVVVLLAVLFSTQNSFAQFTLDVGVAANAAASAGTDTQSQSNAGLVSATAGAQASSACLPQPNCMDKNFAGATASVSGNSISLMTTAERGTSNGSIEFNAADALAGAMFTDVVSFNSVHVISGAFVLEHLPTAPYTLVALDHISGNFLDPLTNISLIASVKVQQLNGQIFSNEFGSFTWNGSSVTVSSDAGPGFWDAAHSEFALGIVLPPSNLQNIEFAVSVGMRTSATSATGADGQATFVDPISFEIFDSAGNIISDLVVDSALGAQYSVVNGFAADGATPLPGTLPLFATGLGALGLLGWRRKRKMI
ncbi:MAG TPA: hypothetical protein VIY48_16680, partial [Candidatus Paceibacterota bacterium]